MFLMLLKHTHVWCGRRVELLLWLLDHWWWGVGSSEELIEECGPESTQAHTRKGHGHLSRPLEPLGLVQDAEPAIPQPSVAPSQGAILLSVPAEDVSSVGWHPGRPPNSWLCSKRRTATIKKRRLMERHVSTQSWGRCDEWSQYVRRFHHLVVNAGK